MLLDEPIPTSLIGDTDTLFNRQGSGLVADKVILV